MIRFIKNLTKIDWLFVFFVFCLIILQVWLELKLPEYMQQITNELGKLKYGIDPSINEILKFGGLMITCAFGSLVATLIAEFFVDIVSAKLGTKMREQIYTKIQSFSPAEMNKFSTASLFTRTTTDIRQVRVFLTFGFQALLKAPIMAVYAIIKIVGNGWQWSVATGVTIAILVVVLSIIMFLVIPKFRKIQLLIDDVNKLTKENLTGIRVIRASNAEEYQKEKFEKANDALTKTSLFTSKLLAILGPGMSFLMALLSLVIYWLGAYIIAPGDINGIGIMMTFMQYSARVIMSFIMLVIVFMMLPRALISSRRINEVLDTQASIVSGEYNGETKNRPSIVFDKVSFKYPKASEYVLKNISFEAKAGETIAFIGSSGSGKSTLINLIPRFYDATEGDILIDGVNIKDYNLSSLYKKIGYVPQKGILFSGSVKDNINFGDNGADDKTIDDAIEISQAKNFVENMPNGINSLIAQDGSNISGGQKQRLSIARAIARKPEIFIFDDSFSALDYKTDKKLRSALKNKIKDATKVIVAQRIGTILDADKIIVLENGEIVGCGTHQELLSSCKVYQEIALSQLSKEEL